MKNAQSKTQDGSRKAVKSFLKKIGLQSRANDFKLVLDRSASKVMGTPVFMLDELNSDLAINQVKQSLPKAKHVRTTVKVDGDKFKCDNFVIRGLGTITLTTYKDDPDLGMHIFVTDSKKVPNLKGFNKDQITCVLDS